MALVCAWGLYAQQVRVDRVFPFGEPFVYYENWDRNEGWGPGISQFGFTLDGNIFLKDAGSNAWLVFDKDFNLQDTVQDIFAGSFTVSEVQGHEFVIGGLYDGWVRVYDERLSLREPQYIIQLSDIPDYLDGPTGFLPFHKTGSMLFAGSGNMMVSNSTNNNPASMELLPNGQIQYRGARETGAWLETDSNAERYG